MFVVSPHLDDAVLGLGHWMAQFEGTLVTVFAGSPPAYPRLRDRPHDEICGLGGLADPMAHRRGEDQLAGDALGWSVVHLAALDAQYVWPAKRTDADAMAIRHAIFVAWHQAGEPGEVWSPAGIGHEDHIDTREAMVWLARTHKLTLGVWYEPGYRTRKAVEARELHRFTPRSNHYLLAPDEAIAKMRLVEHYESQLNGISALALRDALTVEVRAVWDLTIR